MVSQSIFKDAPFTLIDIGCSRGISKSWRVFGKSLRAYAVDPMLSEIEKLKATETNPNVSYHAGYIGLPENHPIVRSRGATGPVANSPWPRLSTAWALELSSRANDNNQIKVKHNRWPETRLADPSTLMTLADFIREQHIDNVDFIKLDIDGNDFYALLSCEDMIESRGVIGFMLEVNYCGSDSDTDHTFHNTDRFMRKHQFELLDLTIMRYSRKALPAPFVAHRFAQTNWGAPLQGDAIYLSDVANPGREAEARQFSNTKLLKAVAICEIFGLPDCAAEVITSYRHQLSELVDVDKLLDLLTPDFNGRTLSYKEYIQLFSNDPQAFYPTAKKHRGKWARRLQTKFKKFSSRFHKTSRRTHAIS